MVRSLGKIEAQDSSPLDVPGRPLAGVIADTSKSWDAQIEPEAPELDDADLAVPDGLRRLGMPPVGPSREARREPPAPPRSSGPVPPLGPEPSAAPDPVLSPEDILAPTQKPEPVPASAPEPAPEPALGPARAPEATATPEPSEKPKRLPPRMRKKMEEEARLKDGGKAEAEPARQKPTGGATDAIAERREPVISPPGADRPSPAAAPVPEPAPIAEPAAEATPAAGPVLAMPVPPPARAPRSYERRYEDGLPAPTVNSAAMASPATAVAAPPAPPNEPPPPSVELAPPPRPPSDSEGRGELAALKGATDLSNCLLPMLEALKWRGDPRHVAEALPHFIDDIDITAFRNIMATLHYESRPIDLQLVDIDVRLMPCLFLPEKGDALILLGRQVGKIQVFDGSREVYDEISVSRLKGKVFVFTAVDADDLTSAQAKVGWFRAVTERFRSLFYQTMGITLILNLLALATPLFVMAVYDKVVATGSIPTLAYFAIGVGIAIVCDLILRTVRSKILAFVGARLDNIVGLAIFHKILFLPPALTERATVGAQVARIKDFESIRDFFTGPMAVTLLEIPFAFVFVAVIIHLAGPLVWVPVIMVALYALLGLIFTPLIRATVSRAARASSRRQELVVEALNNMRAVKYCGAEATWMKRYRDLSAKASLNGFYTTQLSSIVQTLSHVLMVASGVGTIVFGVFRVLEGEMTVGSLVATMMLVWRVLGPLQAGFISMSRITQVKSSIGQINNLMNIKAEREQHSVVNPLRRFEGFVSYARVSLRYSPDADPALVGVSFEAEPGDVICVVGGNGSGKSTVLKLLAGMYQAQAGSIRIDNQDIRQMDQVELRHAVAYVPQSLEFFYGTISQNLRLAHPTATDEDMRWACYKAGVLDDILALEQGSGKWARSGFEVRIGDSGIDAMPTSLMQRLNLARGYLKRAPVMLFDEPGNGLDFEADQTFMRMVDELRGDTTIFIVTHRPSHLRLADKILWLEYGNVRGYGPAEEVMGQMPKDFM